jgi:hypothetical protein
MANERAGDAGRGGTLSARQHRRNRFAGRTAYATTPDGAVAFRDAAGRPRGPGSRPIGERDDPGCMVRILGFLFTVLFAVLGRAQDLHARVEIDDGEVVEGPVVSMDLQSIQIRVGDQVRTLATVDIRQSRFRSMAESSPVDPAAPPAAVDPASPPEKKPRITWTEPLPVPLDTESPIAVPVDLRHASLWRLRLQRIDEVYPWLSPAAPQQWVSLGLLLLVAGSLVVHLSVRVAGAEAASFGRSLSIGAWYLVTGVVQMATVPVNDFTVVLMLLVNPTIALFWLREFYGMTRLGASIAFAVQLGFVALGFGTLELVDAVLGSIGVTTS